ncbi:MAG: hypothetical protein AAF959_19305 [Cyanobacteria bacterium P01_D01_bin.56]
MDENISQDISQIDTYVNALIGKYGGNREDHLDRAVQLVAATKLSTYLNLISLRVANVSETLNARPPHG